MDDDKLIIQDVQTAQPVATEPIHTDRGGSEKPSRACMWEQWWAQQAVSKSCTDHRRVGEGKGIFLWKAGHVVSNWLFREMLVQDMWNMKELSNYRPNATC